MIIYGLYGFTHNGAKALTVMSPEGASAALEAIAADEDVITDAGTGRFTHYLEKRSGALARLVEAHGIIVLDKPDWDAKRAELGVTVLR
jgi:hypothetical protein